MKPYGLGIIVGRFQTIHLGHRAMLDKALEICDEVGVFIGSSQEELTEKNPFSYDLRKELLYKMYGSSVDIFPLPDIGVGNNSKWGDYVLENVVKRFGKKPDLLISGKEERRVSWFGGEQGEGIAELYIPKTIDISATEMRDFLVTGDRESWRSFTDPALHGEFDRLRGIVLRSQGNKDSRSL